MNEPQFSPLRSLTFSSILIILFFGILEGILRIVGVKDPVKPRLILEVMDTDITLPFMRSDPETFWSPTPGFHAVFMGKMVTINSLGLRGKQIAIPKPSGQKRLVCFGDSITFGYGVGDDETYPSALAKDLVGWDVVNAGVTGFTSHQVLHLLRRLAPTLKADLATVLIGWNDGNRRPVDDREYERRIARITSLEGSLDHLYMYRALKGAYLRATVMKGIQWTRGSKGHRSTLDQYRENLEMIVDESQKWGIRPVFIALPHRMKKGEAAISYEYAAILAETAQRKGVPLLSCGPLGFDPPVVNDQYFLDSLHMTPEGNAILARELASQLKELAPQG